MSEFSRDGVMVSCIDKDRCLYGPLDTDPKIIAPISDTPVPNLPLTKGTTCDDVTFVQLSKGVITNTCIEW